MHRRHPEEGRSEACRRCLRLDPPLLAAAISGVLVLMIYSQITHRNPTLVWVSTLVRDSGHRHRYESARWGCPLWYWKTPLNHGCLCAFATQVVVRPRSAFQLRPFLPMLAPIRSPSLGDRLGFGKVPPFIREPSLLADVALTEELRGSKDAASARPEPLSSSSPARPA